VGRLPFCRPCLLILGTPRSCNQPSFGGWHATAHNWIILVQWEPASISSRATSWHSHSWSRPPWQQHSPPSAPKTRLVFRSDELFAVSSFQPSHDKVAASYVLKMLDERVVHGCAAEWLGLRLFALPQFRNERLPASGTERKWGHLPPRCRARPFFFGTPVRPVRPLVSPPPQLRRGRQPRPGCRSGRGFLSPGQPRDFNEDNACAIGATEECVRDRVVRDGSAIRVRGGLDITAQCG
jgi:hypothetical protein